MISARSPCSCLRTHRRPAKTSGPSAQVRKELVEAGKISTLKAVPSTASFLASWLREAILLITMEPAVSPSTGANSKTRTSRISIRAAVSFPWQMRARAPTAPNSSCASRRHHTSTVSMSSLERSRRVGTCSTSSKSSPPPQTTNLSNPSKSPTVAKSRKMRMKPRSRWSKTTERRGPHASTSTRKSSKIAMSLNRPSSTNETKRLRKRLRLRLKRPPRPQRRPKSQ